MTKQQWKLLHSQPFVFLRYQIQFLINFSNFWNIYFFYDFIISKLGKKGHRLHIMYWEWYKDWNQYLMDLWNEEFVPKITFSKYCSFNSHGDVTNPKLGQKGSKLVFNVPMVIERWKSIEKEILYKYIYIYIYIYIYVYIYDLQKIQITIDKHNHQIPWFTWETWDQKNICHFFFMNYI